MRTNRPLVDSDDIHPRLRTSPVAREYERKRLLALYAISPDLKRTRRMLHNVYEALVHCDIQFDVFIIEKAIQYVITCPHCEGCQFPDEDKIALREEHDRQCKQETRLQDQERRRRRRF